MAAMAGRCVVLRRLKDQVLRLQGPGFYSVRRITNETEKSGSQGSSFDTKLLDILVCPLSKNPLRYDPTSNELVCDELGVAYPIVNGIPNLVPSDGRILEGAKKSDQPGEPRSGS